MKIEGESKGGGRAWSCGLYSAAGVVLILSGLLSYDSHGMIVALKTGFKQMVDSTLNYHPPELRAKYMGTDGIEHEVLTVGQPDQDRSSLVQMHKAAIAAMLLEFPKQEAH